MLNVSAEVHFMSLSFFFLCHPRWFAFNLLFVSFYQNVLLFLIVAPSLVAHILVTGCGQAVPLTGYDYFATALISLLIVIEAVVDNEEDIFQTEMYRRNNAGERLNGEYADGFKSCGLFAIARKPHYAAKQAIWIPLYRWRVFRELVRLWVHIALPSLPRLERYDRDDHSWEVSKVCRIYETRATLCS